jgi:hypothetical protein
MTPFGSNGFANRSPIRLRSIEMGRGGVCESGEDRQVVHSSEGEVFETAHFEIAFKFQFSALQDVVLLALTGSIE